ncbi:MAG: sugar ABC transporter substrate-binding protein [Beutenbergiaceae bacterium]
MNRTIRRTSALAALTVAAMAAGTACTVPDPDAPASSAGDDGQTSEVDTVEQGANLNIWYINILTSYPAWNASMEKFVDEAEVGNYTATAVGNTTVDIPANISQAEQAMADGADGIIICDADPTTWGSTISKAQEQGVVVVTIGCVDEISDYSVGTDNKSFGEAAADQIAQDVGEDAVVGIISTDASTPNQVAQIEAFEAWSVQQYPDMVVAASEYDNSETSTAATKMSAMLAANPDINTIWCVEGNCPAAASAGLSEAGKAPGDVYVLGIDTADATRQMMEDGWVNATLDQCWFGATQLVTDLIRGAKEGNPSPQQSWAIPVQAVSADEIGGYAGCPESIYPTLD